jgi:hypothetical protein
MTKAWPATYQGAASCSTPCACACTHHHDDASQSVVPHHLKCKCLSSLSAQRFAHLLQDHASLRVLSVAHKRLSDDGAAVIAWCHARHMHALT